MPADLRAQIENDRRLTEESLAEYLRKAARERLARRKKEKADLKKLADDVVGSIKPEESGWAGLDPAKWQHELRREEDEHMEKRFKETMRQIVSAKSKKKR